ncbi:MAG: transposase [Chloroflexi bacterium]|nr:transposase [Chloroflexota bacterium]
MEHEAKVYGRRSIRLKGYDYTQVGAYFVTIAVRGRLALFGEVVDGEVRLSGAGEMAREVWQAMPQRFPFVEMDAFVVMLDHVHGIVVIRGDGAGAPIGDARVSGRAGAAPTARALGDVVGAYKSLTTAAYIRGVHDAGWPLFHGRLWQRNFYERVVRDECELNELRAYIRDNPLRWEQGGLV